MSTTCLSEESLSPDDRRLIDEAVRRAAASRFNAGVDPNLIAREIIGEACRGTRDIHTLLRAAGRLAQAV